MNLKYSVGLDISSKKLGACISIIDEHQKVTVKSSTKVSITSKGFAQLEKWIIRHRKESLPLVLCMEATGIYHENCAYYFHKL